MNTLPNDVLDIIYGIKFKSDYKNLMEELLDTALPMATFIDVHTHTNWGMRYYLTSTTYHGGTCYYPLFDKDTIKQIKDDPDNNPFPDDHIYDFDDYEDSDEYDVKEYRYLGKVYYYFADWDYDFFPKEEEEDED